MIYEGSDVYSFIIYGDILEETKRFPIYSETLSSLYFINHEINVWNLWNLKISETVIHSGIYNKSSLRKYIRISYHLLTLSDSKWSSLKLTLFSISQIWDNAGTEVTCSADDIYKWIFFKERFFILISFWYHWNLFLYVISVPVLQRYGIWCIFLPLSVSNGSMSTHYSISSALAVEILQSCTKLSIRVYTCTHKHTTVRRSGEAVVPRFLSLLFLIFIVEE